MQSEIGLKMKKYSKKKSKNTMIENLAELYN